MNMQTCPYCKEKIYSNALVCRYCKRDLPANENLPKRNHNWIPTLLATAFLVTGLAFLTHEYLKERQTWLEK